MKIEMYNLGVKIFEKSFASEALADQWLIEDKPNWGADWVPVKAKPYHKRVLDRFAKAWRQ